MKKIIVFSADGMVGEDLALLEKMPNFQRYLSKGARINRVQSIYPTVTYPAHITMSTGAYPNVHGVVSNYKMLPGVHPAVWQWMHTAVKCEDIFDAVKASGRTTAASFWPCTGCHPSIDYLVDECWTTSPEETIPEVFARHGASEEVLEIVRRNMYMLQNGRENKSPWNENFCVRCAADMIRQYQPDFLMLHPANIDAYRHESGVFSPLVEHGVHETDTWIGEIIEAAIDAGVWEDTNFFLVSDHGLRNISRSININTLLKKAGLIEVAEDGTVNYQAYCMSNGMSALIYLNESASQSLEKEVYDLLCRWRDDGVYGIGKVFTREETAARGLDGAFSFVLETDGYTSFSDVITDAICRPLDNSDYRVGAATHGYLPELGPQPILVANGPDIRQGVVLERNSIVNEAPTYAAIFGLELKDAVGKPIYEILK